MAVTTITQIPTANAAVHVAAFSNGADLYALWSADEGLGRRSLWWRRHDLGLAGDVRAQLVASFLLPSAVLRFDGVLLVGYADSSTHGTVWVAGFDLVTGAVSIAPVAVADGTAPALTVLPGARPGRVTLVYLRRGEVYLRETLDGGRTWSLARPALSTKVQETSVLAAVPFDGAHVSVAQVGSTHRVISEVAAFPRTRPVTSLAPAPVDGRFYAAEAAQRTVAAAPQLSDNLRGRLAVLDDGTLVGSTRARLGASDGVGDVMTLDATAGLSLASSATTPAGATSGADAVVAGGVVANALFGASNAAVVDVAASGGLVYFAGSTDAGADGALAVLRLADAAVALPLTGVRVRALAVQNGVLAAATTEGGGERLRLYSEDGLAPALAATHALPLRANGLTFAAGGALLYVCGGARCNVYAVGSLTRPIRLVDTYQLLTGGLFHRVAISSRGFVVAAAGAAGVRVYSPTGDPVAGALPSGPAAPAWRAGAAHAVNDLVRPTAAAPYAYARTYFRCTGAGASGAVEPPWTGAQAVPDGGATWTEVDACTGYVTDVVLDEPRHQIVAAGLAGGPSATLGRVWLIEARQVLP